MDLRYADTLACADPQPQIPALREVQPFQFGDKHGLELLRSREVHKVSRTGLGHALAANAFSHAPRTERDEGPVVGGQAGDGALEGLVIAGEPAGDDPGAVLLDGPRGELAGGVDGLDLDLVALDDDLKVVETWIGGVREDAA